MFCLAAVAELAVTAAPPRPRPSAKAPVRTIRAARLGRIPNENMFYLQLVVLRGYLLWVATMVTAPQLTPNQITPNHQLVPPPPAKGSRPACLPPFTSSAPSCGHLPPGISRPATARAPWAGLGHWSNRWWPFWSTRPCSAWCSKSKHPPWEP